MKEPLKVLHLARWYPNRYDPMPGLFIQRHAEAAARCCKVGVVYTHVDDAKPIKGYELEFKLINKVPTACVYYNSAKCSLPLLSPVMKAFRFFKANLVGIRKIRSELGGVDLIHVHILTRLGILALWYKWSKKIPYVISEHWSRYLSLTGDFKGIFRKWMTRLVVRNASVVTTVTHNLADAMQKHGLKNKNYIVLANVVSDDFLKKERVSRQKGAIKKLIHVSCFEDKSKNISGLLRVVQKLSTSHPDFLFVMVGEGMDFDAMTAYADKLGIDRSILKFTGLLEGRELVNEMADADLSVIFSNYENLPVVINEGFVLGVPVIATRVGGIPEIVNETNGLLVPAGDEDALERKLSEFMEGKYTFDNDRIRSDHQKMFSPETLGAKLCNIYREVTGKQDNKI